MSKFVGGPDEAEAIIKAIKSSAKKKPAKESDDQAVRRSLREIQDRKDSKPGQNED
jgi:hypothetical protein